MTPEEDPAFQHAMDKLLLQVNNDNIIAVQRVFKKQANDLRDCLLKAKHDTQLGPCGGDPVSQDVLKEGSFGGKINQLIDIHWAHWRELEAVVRNLGAAAQSYGFTEAEIADSMKDLMT